MFSRLARGSLSALSAVSIWAVSIWAVSTPGFLWAHPGHGHAEPDSPSHYLLSFEHTAPVLAAILIASAIVLGLRMLRVEVRA